MECDDLAADHTRGASLVSLKPPGRGRGSRARPVDGVDPKADADEILRWCRDVVTMAGELESAAVACSDAELQSRTGAFRARLGTGDPVSALLPEAFATVREAARRSIGLRHHDVQLIGGAVLHLGKIAEMRTGEGKTLTATLAAYLGALAGQSVHVMTANEYLAGRDYGWMLPVYEFSDCRPGLCGRPGNRIRLCGSRPMRRMSPTAPGASSPTTSYATIWPGRPASACSAASTLPSSTLTVFPF
jgi:hypothetical protein